MTENERLARLEQWVEDHQRTTAVQMEKLHASHLAMMNEIRQNNHRLWVIENKILMYTRFVLWVGIGLGGVVGVVVRNWNYLHGLIHKL